MAVTTEERSLPWLRLLAISPCSHTPAPSSVSELETSAVMSLTLSAPQHSLCPPCVELLAGQIPWVSRLVRFPSPGLPEGGWRAHLQTRSQCSGSRWEGGGTPIGGHLEVGDSSPCVCKPRRRAWRGSRKQAASRWYQPRDQLEVGACVGVWPSLNPAVVPNGALSSLSPKPRQGGLHAGL